MILTTISIVNVAKRVFPVYKTISCNFVQHLLQLLTNRHFVCNVNLLVGIVQETISAFHRYEIN